MNSNKSKTSCKRGFTLIELLVVVLIIGILAAVAVPQYKIAVLKSRLAQAKILVDSIVKAQEVYYLANGAYSSSYEELEINTPDYVKETDDFANNGVNRPHRVFPWGKCIMWQNASASCTINGIMYIAYYSHLNTKSGKRECVTYNTNLSSKENKLCKSDTGSSTPSETGDGYIRWTYQ